MDQPAADQLAARIITLEEAVTQIKQACEDYQQLVATGNQPTPEASAQLPLPQPEPPTTETAQPGNQTTSNNLEQTGRLPFFFLVGAGISFPDVPLAGDITKQCKAYAQKFNIVTEPAASGSMESYSHWFDRAYPHPKQRQMYLRSLIEKKPISLANFRLAHLLSTRRIANLLVTLNFDDFISRALVLFGRPHIVCDHPATVERINPEQNDIQILHVHGTYWFYDCVNLGAEISERALISDQTNATMAYKLDDVMERSSPIVLGYSGWENDVVMRSLKRRLSTTLPYNIYWFCYQKENLLDLPLWLREKRQVCFVLPPEPPPDGQDSSSPDGRPTLKREPATRSSVKDASVKQEAKPTLSAQTVLEALHQAFLVDPPQLTQDPLGFFADQLSNVLPKNTKGEVIDHGYSLRSVIEYARELSKEHPLPESQFKKALDALQSSKNREAVIEAGKINLAKLTEAQLRDLMDAMWAAASGLYDNSKEEMAGYDLVILIGDLLNLRTSDGGVQLRILKALYNKGGTFSALDQPHKALKVYEEILKRANDTTDPALLAYVAGGLTNMSATLYELNRLPEALEIIEQIRSRFGATEDAEINEWLALALSNKAAMLVKLRRFEDAAVTYEEVINRFGSEQDPIYNEYLGGALNGLGFYRLVQAKKLWAEGNEVEARTLLSQAQELLAESLVREPDQPITMGNQSYAAFLLGNVEDARTLLTKAINLGGEELRKTELEDSTIHPLPRDEEFRALIRSIPEAEPKVT